MRLSGEVVVGEDETVYGEDLDHVGKKVIQRLFYYEVFA